MNKLFYQKKTLFMILLQFQTIFFCYKLCVLLRGEHTLYVNKLKFPIFQRVCCQYPLINYLEVQCIAFEHYRLLVVYAKTIPNRLPF